MKNPDIYATVEVGRCLLCHDPLCSKACKVLDTGRATRSYYLQNKQGSNLRLADAPDSASCATKEYLRACICGRVDKPIDIPFLISHIRENQSASEFTSKDVPSLEIELCGIRCETPFVLASSVITSTYDMCVLPKLISSPECKLNCGRAFVMPQAVKPSTSRLRAAF